MSLTPWCSASPPSTRRGAALVLAVQAYQTRALAVIEHVAATRGGRGCASWCGSSKGLLGRRDQSAQEAGLPGYPVFTHKAHADLSYLACAAALIEQQGVIYPQFATHNAATLAAVVQMAQAAGAGFELQRLHGMGEGIYREFSQAHSHRACASTHRWASIATCWLYPCGGC